MNSEIKNDTSMGIEDRLEKIESKLDEVAAKGAVFAMPNTGFFSSPSDDEIDLRELWNAIWEGKWIVIGVTFVFAVASVFYALTLQNIYKSDALLAPSEEAKGGGLSALAGNLSGLASLAGVSLGRGESDKTVIAMEVMRSRRFIMTFIEKYDLLVPLMAAKGWDRATQKLIIDKNLYNEVEKKWVRDVKPPLQAKPTDWEIYNKFSKILSLSQDKQTRLVTVAMEHYSPHLAQELVVSFVQEINAVMRERDLAEATKSIKYLNYQLERTPVADMRLVFSQLIEEQTKTMMLAEVRDEYVFMTIDPAVVPDRKVKPRRAVICILGVFIGGMLGLLIVLIRYFAQSNVDEISEK